MSPFVVSVPDTHTRTALGKVPDGVEVIDWDLTGPAPRQRIDMVVCPPFATPAHMELVEDVETALVQVPSIGYDGIIGKVPAGKVIANGSSVHEAATAELTLALLLAVARDVPRMVRAQDNANWEKFFIRGLTDCNVLMVGYGGVGKAIAARLEPFEVTLTRIASTARDDEQGHIHGVAELPELLPRADVVIVIVPLTPATDGMVDDDFLAAMQDGAILVNVARGRVADTDALVRHADRLRIAVDVTEPEPLPADNPLWQTAALIAPHVGGVTAALAPRLGRLLQRQIAHLLAGEEPENVVIRT